MYVCTVCMYEQYVCNYFSICSSLKFCICVYYSLCMYSMYVQYVCMIVIISPFAAALNFASVSTIAWVHRPLSYC